MQIYRGFNQNMYAAMADGLTPGQSWSSDRDHAADFGPVVIESRLEGVVVGLTEQAQRDLADLNSCEDRVEDRAGILAVMGWDLRDEDGNLADWFAVKSDVCEATVYVRLA